MDTGSPLKIKQTALDAQRLNYIKDPSLKIKIWEQWKEKNTQKRFSLIWKNIIYFYESEKFNRSGNNG